MQKKKFLKITSSIMLAIALLFCFVEFTDFGTKHTIVANASTAKSGQCGDNITWVLNDGILTIEGTGDMYDYNSYHSDPSPFLNGTDITSIVISKGVTHIGDGAFINCTRLKSVTMPEGLDSIGDYAFQVCTKLESIKLPEGVTTIGAYAFYACRNLASVEIPGSVKTIYPGVFSSCQNLTTVVLSEGVPHINAAMFKDCTSLTNIDIPDSVGWFGMDAFANCSSLTSIKAPGGINERTFYKCSNLTSIELPETLTWIHESAFAYCSRLVNIKIPKKVRIIEKGAFAHCSSLTSIEIPENVESIGESAFYDCSNLTSIKLSKNVTTIGESAFYDCSKLTSIALPENVRSIGESAFYGCSSLTSIEIPESVIYILESTFHGCSSLTSIKIPDGIISISAYAFEDCNNLVIQGYKDSYAEEYSKKYNIPFLVICQHDASSHINYDAEKATCMKGGYTAGVYCTKCEAWISGHRVVTATGHNYKTTTIKATISKNGSITTKCSACNNITNTTTIYRPKTVTLSAKNYVYNGKVKTPSVTVKNSSGNTLARGTDYTIAYASNRKNVGTYKVTIKFKGNYSGTIAKTFDITPATTAISKITAKTKGFTVKWAKKTAQVTGYQIQYSTTSSFKNAKIATISKNNTTSKTISKLARKKKYYVRVRTYKTINGKKYYSSWSSKKIIKTK